MRATNPLLVFSHLRWDFVYQRPQHLLSRLAKHWPVVYIEEPVYSSDPEAYWEKSRPSEGVLVCRPHTPVKEGGYNDAQMPTLSGLLSKLVVEEDLEDCLVWLYTPMALPLAQQIEPRALIFDVMDELSAFKFAPAQLREREAETMREADVVFTGGVSLYRAKRSRHNNIHCFPSSVEADHFRKALHVEEPEDQAGIPHPRLGYYGVIDERIDLELLDRLASSDPDRQIVMVGPVVKIDPENLPKHPNLHFLGQRRYEELPHYLGGWDVCLMPFALNESTRFISPTKTLEYMAAEKPVVSTSITDVAEPYGHIVRIADGPEAFIAACDEALRESDEERLRRVLAMRQVLENTSWDQTANLMARLIDEVVESKLELAGEMSGATPAAR